MGKGVSVTFADGTISSLEPGYTVRDTLGIPKGKYPFYPLWLNNQQKKWADIRDRVLEDGDVLRCGFMVELEILHGLREPRREEPDEPEDPMDPMKALTPKQAAWRPREITARVIARPEPLGPPIQAVLIDKQDAAPWSDASVWYWELAMNCRRQKSELIMLRLGRPRAHRKEHT